MITYTPPKVEILTDRSWGSTPESNMKSIIQALEVCRDSKIPEEDYKKVITKFCFPGQRKQKNGKDFPPHLRLLEFTNFEFGGKAENWVDIDIPEFIDAIWDYSAEGRPNNTCSLRGHRSSQSYDSIFKENHCSHANLPMTHPAKRIMIRIECSSKVGHHLRTHGAVRMCAQSSSSMPLSKGFKICYKSPERFDQNLPRYFRKHEEYMLLKDWEEAMKIPKKEREANQELPTDWIMRPRVGVASRRQWFEFVQQREDDPNTHPETLYVCQMIREKLEAMKENR